MVSVAGMLEVPVLMMRIVGTVQCWMAAVSAHKVDLSRKGMRS